LRYGSCQGRRRGPVGATPTERGIARAAAPRLALSARDADDCQVVFGGGGAGGGEPFDEAADAVDLPLPLGIFAPQAVAAVLPLDWSGRHRQLHDVEREPERLDVFAMAVQII